jgi:hypothetical protein
MNLENIAGATGLNPEGLRMLMLKFQEKVTEARAKPDAESTVSSFVNEKDQGVAFFNFLKGAKKLSDEQRDYVFSDVFGARQVGKASEFLNSFDTVIPKLKLLNADATTGLIKSMAFQEGRQRILKVITNRDEFIARSRKIKGGMITDEDARERLLGKELTKDLDPKSYAGMKAAQMKADEVAATARRAYLEGAKMLPQAFDDLAAMRDHLADIYGGLMYTNKTRTMRGVKPDRDK